MVVEDFGGREVQFPDNRVDRKVGGVNRRVLLLDLKVPLLFLHQGTGRLDQVVVFDERFVPEGFFRKVVFIILVGGAALPVEMFDQIPKIIFGQAADLKAPCNLAFQELFHLLKTPDFFLIHGHKIPHQGVVHFMDELGDGACRFPAEVFERNFLFIQHQLEAEEEAVVYLILPNHGDKRLRLLVDLLKGDRF